MSVANTFIDKLKDQSFTIILMIGGLYYQNQMFQQQLNRYDAIVKEKQEYINKIVDAERERMLAREQYLMKQRDEFVQMLKEKYHPSLALSPSNPYNDPTAPSKRPHTPPFRPVHPFNKKPPPTKIGVSPPFSFF